MQAMIHAADVQDRDGGALLMSALLDVSPFLTRLFADGGIKAAIHNQGRTKWTLPTFPAVLKSPYLTEVLPPPLLLPTLPVAMLTAPPFPPIALPLVAGGLEGRPPETKASS